MSPWLLLALMSLATFRLTRLIIKDSFPPIRLARDKIKYSRPPHVVRSKMVTQDEKKWVVDPAQDKYDYWWLGELLTCTWCASAYVSGGVTVAVWAAIGLPLPVLWWFAVWGAGAALAAKIG